MYTANPIKSTLEQKKILLGVKKTNSNIAVIAGAGCGKSTTCQLISDQQSQENPLYIAFNKDISEQFKKKSNSPSITQHSFSLSLLRRKENFNVIQKYYSNEVAKILKIDSVTASQVIKTINKFFYSLEEKPVISMVNDKFIFVSGEEDNFYKDNILQLTIKFWDWIKQNKIYSHDCYVKILQLYYPELINQRYGLFIVDEFQDTNPAFIDILLRHPQQKLFIGDPFQSIYQWRGAEASFESVEKVVTNNEYKLSVSFRFSDSIAQLANKIISFRKRDFLLKGIGSSRVLSDQTALIQRTNLGCLREAIRLMEQREPFHLIGGIAQEEHKILADLQAIYFKHPDKCKTSECKMINNFEQVEALVEEEERRDEFGGEWSNRIKLIQNLGGFQRCIDNLADLEFLSKHHQDNPNAYIITTAHRSKGLEYPKVLIGHDFLRKFKAPEESFGLTGIKHAIEHGTPEEMNLLYVAVTRAQKSVDLSNLAPLFPHQPTIVE